MFGCHDGCIYCLAVDTGNMLWRVDTAQLQPRASLRFRGRRPPNQGAHIVAASIGFDPIAPVEGVPRTIVFAAQRGVLCVAALRAGGPPTLLDALQLGGDIFSSPVLSGARCLVGSRDDHLYCFDVRLAGSVAESGAD